MNGLLHPAMAPQAWAVGALVRALADALSARFNPVRVVGEISAFTRAGSGHCYFTLKDEAGQLRCAMFRRAAESLTRLPADGDRVELEGRIDLYAPRGDLQLIVERLTPAGQGQLLEQFLRLKARLEAEGLFEESRKRALHPMPQAVAVVTSLGAAALRDVASTLARRIPQTPVVVFPAAVQGVEAPAALCAALQAAYRWHTQQVVRGMAPTEGVTPRGGGTVLLLVRGGGSLEDLWAFNDERVVRTLAAAPMPTVSGVGHQTDFTLADFVADVRAPTPTAAAELCAREARYWLQALSGQQQALAQAVHGAQDARAQRLDGLAARLVRPTHELRLQTLRLANMHTRLSQVVHQKLELKIQSNQAIGANLVQSFHQQLQGQQRRHAHREAVLSAMDPRLVLQRGYAWLQTEAGHALTQAKEAQAGDRLTAFLADGEVALTVR